MIFALAFSLHIFLGVFFGQGSRPLAWASTPWAICRTDRLSTIDYRKSHGAHLSRPSLDKYAPWPLRHLNLKFLTLLENSDLDTGGAMGRTCPDQVWTSAPHGFSGI